MKQIVIDFILEYLSEIISGIIFIIIISIKLCFYNKTNKNILKNKQGNNSNNIQINCSNIKKG
ncbi:MAG: hypothetical protein J6J27_05580 [Alphaproteobacteria bacterium]|nr:hypothetical protein [Alphaproteobacteria bacterium]